MSLLSTVTKTAPSLPSRVYLYAAEKWGKTSFAAYAPNPIFVMTEGETGLLSLLEAGRVPEVAHFPDDVRDWDQLTACVKALLLDDHDFKTLVLDTANGAERLLAAHVLQHDFNGVMSGKEGYASYGKGDLACVPKWTEFLRLLDDVRIKRKMGIFLLAHSKIKSVNNPEGSDYDQLRPEGIDKLWGLTHKWADVIACGTHEVFVKDDKAKETKGRQLRTSGSLAVVAGNRYGLPEKIPCGATAESAHAAFDKALVAAKAAGAKPSTPEQQAAILGHLKTLGFEWSAPFVLKRTGQIIGRTLAPADQSASLTAPEADKLIAELLISIDKKKTADGPKPATDPAPAKTPPAGEVPPADVRNSAPAPQPAPAPSPAPAAEPEPVPAPEDRGDSWEPPADEPAPAPLSSKIPEAVARTIAGEMAAVEITWPSLRGRFAEVFGVAPEREILVLLDLTLEEAEKVRGWLKTQKKPSKSRKAGAA